MWTADRSLWTSCQRKDSGKKSVLFSSVNVYSCTIMPQICLSVAGGVAMMTKSSVVYINSGCSFSSTRLTQMLATKGLNKEVICHVLQELLILFNFQQIARLLQRIKVYQVNDIFELLNLLGTLRKNIAEQIDRFHSNVHMVILDAITLFISPILGGRQFHGNKINLISIGV